MKNITRLFAIALLTALLVPATYSQTLDNKQEQKQEQAKADPKQEPAADVEFPDVEQGMVEFGVRDQQQPAGSCADDIDPRRAHHRSANRAAQGKRHLHLQLHRELEHVRGLLA